ncbi:MAG: hypothetical protein NTY70_18800 [Burkholderiales bacterium]|nr:hypothetical protein [Burkholderiales bacterium]
MQALFELSARAWCARDSKHYQFKGLRLFAILKHRRHARTAAHFGAKAYVRVVANYPQVHGVTLTDVATHLIHSAAFGPYNQSEIRYAKERLKRQQSNSTTG